MQDLSEKQTSLEIKAATIPPKKRKEKRNRNKQIEKEEEERGEEE